jgi:hypothetical protein
MTREQEWSVFEKACEITASAVRGTMGAEGSKSAGYVADVFKEIYKALKDSAADLTPAASKAGF